MIEEIRVWFSKNNMAGLRRFKTTEVMNIRSGVDNGYIMKPKERKSRSFQIFQNLPQNQKG